MCLGIRRDLKKKMRIVHVLLAILALALTSVDCKPRASTQRSCQSYKKSYFSLLQASKACSTGTYVCEQTDGYRKPSCIQKEFVCDGEKHCPNGDDESNCEPVCSTGNYRCASGQCATLCDGNDECDGGDDEDRCACGVNEFRCDNGTCVARCDGNPDCGSGADELNCPCASGRVRCSNGTCAMKCNGIRECADGIDETICRSVCENGEVQCAGGQCATLCNKMVECNGPEETVMDEDPFLCYGTICRQQDYDTQGCTNALTRDDIRLCEGNGTLSCHPLQGRLEYCPDGQTQPCIGLCTRENVADTANNINTICALFGYTSGTRLLSQPFGMFPGTNTFAVSCNPTSCVYTSTTACVDADILHIMCTP